MELKKLSEEQQQIISNIKLGYNVIVDAVAGCGKTTTSLHLCKEMNHKKILMLTYNSGLKLDTRKKIDIYNINNLQVHSYHSFCLMIYNQPCYDDICLYNLINSDNEIKTDYDIIILDEQQDMKPLFHDLVQKILKNNSINPQLLLLGDIYQNIYAYQGANHKYLIEADKIFNTNREWKRLSINTTFRMTKPITDFINNILLRNNRLISNKNGNKCDYFMTNTFNPINILNMIKTFINKGYKYDDIFILVPSINSKTTPVKRLENMCVYNNIPCFASISDNVNINEEIIKGKIVFTSFHQSKGLERKIVFVYCMDSSYYWYAKSESKENCPNPIYVACTRALDHLILIHNINREHLPFIDESKLDENTNIYGNLNVKVKKDIQNVRIINKTVTDFIKTLDFNNLIKLFKNFKCEIISKPLYNIEINNKVINKFGLYEDVTNTNGIAIPAYYEMLTSKTCKIYDEIIHNIDDLPQEHQEKIKIISKNSYSNKFVPIEDILYLSVIQECRLSGYWSKLNQIDNYKWLIDNEINQKNFEKILRIINKNMNKNINRDYEYRISKEITPEYNIVGLIDCIDHSAKIIWEFKCVSYISDNHLLQLALYATISRSLFPDYKYRILNILTGEVKELDLNSLNIYTIIEDIVKSN